MMWERRCLLWIPRMWRESIWYDVRAANCGRFDRVLEFLSGSGLLPSDSKLTEDRIDEFVETLFFRTEVACRNCVMVAEARDRGCCWWISQLKNKRREVKTALRALPKNRSSGEDSAVRKIDCTTPLAFLNLGVSGTVRLSIWTASGLKWWRESSRGSHSSLSGSRTLVCRLGISQGNGRWANLSCCLKTPSETRFKYDRIDPSPLFSSFWRCLNG